MEEGAVGAERRKVSWHVRRSSNKIGEPRTIENCIAESLSAIALSEDAHAELIR